MDKVIRINAEAYELMQRHSIETGISIKRIATDAIMAHLYKEPKKKEKKKVHPDFQAMKDAYFEYWKLKYRMNYAGWNVVDAQAMNGIIRKIELINQSDASTVDFWKQLLTKLPEFWQNKSLASINKNFNKVVLEAKTGSLNTKYDWR